MPEEDTLTASERETRDALSRVKLPRVALEVSQIRWEAQRRRAIHQVWRWRGIAAALAAGIVLTLIVRPKATVIERVVYVAQTEPSVSPSPQPPLVAKPQEASPPFPGDDYFALRRRVLALGIGVLRPPAHAGHSARPRPVPTASPFFNPDSLRERDSL